MPTYPHGPRLLKGAIVASAQAGVQTTTIGFPSKPEEARRSVQPQIAGGDQGQRSRAVRYTGAAVETIDVEVMVDATGRLEGGGLAAGIYPQLAVLELLA